MRLIHKIYSKQMRLEQQIKDILEHLRYSASVINSWELKEPSKLYPDGQFVVECIYTKSKIFWNMVKNRAKTFTLIIEDEGQLV